MTRWTLTQLGRLHLLVDALLVVLGWLGAYWLRSLFSAQFGAINPLLPYLQGVPLLLLAWLIAAWLFGLYRNLRGRNTLQQAQALLQSIVLCLLLLSSIGFFARGLSFGRSVVLLSTALNGLLLSINWIVFTRWIERHRQNQETGIRTLIVGTSEASLRLLQKLQGHSEKEYRILGFLSEDESLKSYGERPVLGSFAQIRSLVEAQDIQEAFLILPDKTPEEQLSLVLDCDGLSTQFWMLTDFFDVLTRETDRRERIEQLPLVPLGNQEVNSFYAPFKRLFDFTASLFGLLLTLPLWFWWAYRIKKDSPGPVFFSQLRVGKDGRQFKMYKFRTMSTESNPYEEAPREDQDPRITEYGAWLRRTSIDELPQLFNVLKGDMSLVGPRPEMPFIVEQYKPWQMQRTRVLPGITGLWQILGRKDLPMHENLQYDFYYIRNRSLLLDFSILIRTVTTVLLQKGAY